jgi:DNA-binding CsgD family transcriptional regulator
MSGRFVDLRNQHRDLRAIQGFLESQGTLNMGAYFAQVEREGWLRRYPKLFRLYEEEGQLRGYTGLVPIYRTSYQEFLDGPRNPWEHANPTDFLTPAEEERDRITGLWYWLAAITCATRLASDAGWQDLHDHLCAGNVQGIVATTSSAESETAARRVGMRLVRDFGICPTGVRRLWRADDELLAQPATEGTRPDLYYLFQNVRRQFRRAGETVLALSPRQREVARRFYIDGETAEAIANKLGLKPTSVLEHLRRVRERADERLGHSDRSRLTGFFHRNPSELGEKQPEHSDQHLAPGVSSELGTLR